MNGGDPSRGWEFHFLTIKFVTIKFLTIKFFTIKDKIKFMS